jgi:hypothetical protein
MAVKKSGESKQGLIIALVFFVLISIGLGVATFYGFDGQERLRDAASKEKKEADQAKKARDWEQFQNLILKVYLGHQLAPEDNELFTTRLGQYDQNALGKDEKNKPDFDALLAKLKQDAGWDEAKKQPAKPLLNEMKRLQTDNTNLATQNAKLKDDNAKAVDKLSKDLAEGRKALDDQNAKLKASEEEKVKIQNAKTKEFMDLQAKYDGLSEEVDKIKKSADLAKDEDKKKLDKLSKELATTKTNLDKAREQLRPTNLLDYDQPKGKVVGIDRTGQVVYVNLGTQDRVKPQLTFSVFGAGPNGKASAERKGAIEITKVMESHLSQGRITEMTDGNRDPIVKDDLLFNPTWSTTIQQHVAIAGLIDLTGEGTDNTLEFVHSLERQGVVVDAYLDMNDLSVKGPGISLKTNYLVLGEQPEFDANTAINKDDVRTASKMTAQNKIAQMQEEAHKMGVAAIPYRRFMAVIGYPLPRVLTTRAGTAGFLESPSLGSALRAKEKDKADKDKAAKEAKDATDKEEKVMPKSKEKPEKEAPKEKPEKETPNEKEK